MNVVLLFFNTDEVEESSEVLVFSTMDKCINYIAEHKIEEPIMVPTKVDSHEN